jgi:hypothetical protein
MCEASTVNYGPALVRPCEGRGIEVVDRLQTDTPSGESTGSGGAHSAARTAVFDRAIVDLTREHRGTLQSRADLEAMILRGQRVHHLLHLAVLAVLTTLALVAGLLVQVVPIGPVLVVPCAYLGIWVFLATTGGIERDRITIDARGKLTRTRSGRFVETRSDLLRVGVPILLIAATGTVALWLIYMLVNPPFPSCNVGDLDALPAACYFLPTFGGASQGAPLSVDQTRILEEFMRAFALVYLLAVLLPAVWFLRRMLTGRPVAFIRPIYRGKSDPGISGYVDDLVDVIPNPRASAALAFVRTVGLCAGAALLAVLTYELTLGGAWSPKAAPLTADVTPTDTPRPTVSIDLVAAGVNDAGTVMTGGMWARRGSTILVSPNVAAGWTQISLSAVVHPGDQLLALSVVDTRTTVAVIATELNGAWSTIAARTDDAGAHWSSTAIATGPITGTAKLSFVDGKSGFVALGVGTSPSAVFATGDGGLSWAKVASLPAPGAVFGATDASTIWSGGARIDSMDTPTLWVSRDHGAKWALAPLKVPGGPDLTYGQTLIQAPQFFTSASGVVLVLDRHDLAARLGFLTTSDGGATWTESLAPQYTAGTSDAAYMLDRSHWFVSACERKLQIYYSGNGGQSWKNLGAVGLGDNWVPRWLHFTDLLNGTALVTLDPARQNAQVLVTTEDGGESWTQVTFGSAAPAYQAEPTNTL